MNLSREEIVRYRVDRANETLDEARELAATTHWHGTLNRIYYACFYAVTAALHAKGHTSKKHSGVLSLFAVHLVKPGSVSKELGRFYNRLFAARQDLDYTDFAQVDPIEVRVWLSTASEFVATVTELAHRQLKEDTE